MNLPYRKPPRGSLGVRGLALANASLLGAGLAFFVLQREKQQGTADDVRRLDVRLASLDEALQRNADKLSSMSDVSVVPIMKLVACREGMTPIPGGEFFTYETKERAKVAPFCLDVTEVTVTAYSTCVASGSCTRPYSTRLTDGVEEPDGQCNELRDDRKDHPVNCVDWSQANTYCEAQGARLPNDQEWEWAARGGEHGWLYPWGNEFSSERACWATVEGTCRVGQRSSGDNPWGVHDLAGNVLEWTSSYYNGHPPQRSLRGGAWLNALPAMLTAGTRYGYLPADRRSIVGFRCAANAR